MKSKILLMLFILPFCCALNAQNFYVKPYVRYHQSISSQIEPDFYLVEIYVPAPGEPLALLNSASDDFTLASGLKYGLTVGYTFRNNMGVELSADYFNRHKVFTPVEN
ncbi:hypothetical protein [Viscerimonas tarda]